MEEFFWLISVLWTRTSPFVVPSWHPILPFIEDHTNCYQYIFHEHQCCPSVLTSTMMSISTDKYNDVHQYWQVQWCPRVLTSTMMSTSADKYNDIHYWYLSVLKTVLSCTLSDMNVVYSMLHISMRWSGSAAMYGMYGVVSNYTCIYTHTHTHIDTHCGENSVIDIKLWLSAGRAINTASWQNSTAVSRALNYRSYIT